MKTKTIIFEFELPENLVDGLVSDIKRKTKDKLKIEKIENGYRIKLVQNFMDLVWLKILGSGISFISQLFKGSQSGKKGKRTYN